jgi:ribonucleoside-diphosphate reductase alpha subunit
MSSGSADGSDRLQDPHVINRHGDVEPMNINQINDRIRSLCQPGYGSRLRGVSELDLMSSVLPRVKSGMHTREIDNIIIELCRSKAQTDSCYADLSARLVVSNLQKSITSPFAKVYTDLYEKHGTMCRIAPGFITLISQDDVAALIEEAIDYRRDFSNTAFSIATIMRSYLLRDPVTKEIVELPQHMYMRIALQIHCMQGEDSTYVRGTRAGPRTGSVPVGNPNRKQLKWRLETAIETYNLLSTKMISHATPTVINAGTTIPQMSSCFQACVPDSLDGLYQVVHDTALMSKTAGGVSIDISGMRADGSLIASSGGASSGIKYYMQLLQCSQKYANQGGVRPGAFAMYLAAWHADVLAFLDMALPRGPRFEAREDACKLKYALWMSDRFLLAVEQEIENRAMVADGREPTPAQRAAARWHLMSPDQSPRLQDVFDERGPDHPDGPGGEFSDLYDRYVSEGRYCKIVSPLSIIKAVCKAIGQRGYPYMLSKDNANRQSNLAHQVRRADLPADEPFRPEVTNCTVKSSNLCAEVIIPCQYNEEKYEDAMFSVCNLAAVNLERFVEMDCSAPHGMRMDWAGIISAAGVLATNLDNIIDVNYTDVEACRRSNQHYRAIGIGVMGLADVFHRFNIAFGSEDAIQLDTAIHACIYFGATHRSACLARARGCFPAFEASRSAEGVLQPDICTDCGILRPDWADTISTITRGALTADQWDDLRVLVKGGLRNGYVTALMPTATSSNAAGVNECFEPRTSQMYMRRTLAGEYTITNQHLQRALERMHLWNPRTAAHLERSGGSVASWDGSNGTPRLSQEMRDVFSTARELDPMVIVRHSVARNPFISQSQSLNAYRKTVSVSELLKIWLTGWRSGLATMSYYIHTQPASGSSRAADAPPASVAPVVPPASVAPVVPPASVAPVVPPASVAADVPADAPPIVPVDISDEELTCSIESYRRGEPCSACSV